MTRATQCFFSSALIVTLMMILSSHATPAWGSDSVSGGKADLVEVQIPSTYDGTKQPALMYVPPKSNAAVPLLVSLHSWSSNYRQKDTVEPCLAECRQRGWALVVPNFRGPNRRPEACASPAARQDILDAVDYMKRQTAIDPSRIYLIGCSGGGHMTLVMATHAPQLWAAVSAWVPITDLAAWHAQNRKSKCSYDKMLEQVCGGAPGTSAEVDRQYHVRSSLPFLAQAKGLPVDINVGIHDGHTGSVPICHSLWAFNALAEANGAAAQKLTDEQIDTMTAQQKIPEPLTAEREDDPLRQHPILFRRQAGPARVTIFEGGHEGDRPTGIRWLATHQRTGNDTTETTTSGAAE